MRSQIPSVVVANDHKGSRDIILGILKSGGATDIRFAEDGGEAFRLICMRPPGLVILDLELPHDGVTTLRQIRRAESSPDRRLPVIMMTAYATKARIEAMRDSGATEIVTKPLTAARLLSRIDAVLTHPRLFIETEAYIGPDRRRFKAPNFEGPFRRAGDKRLDVFEIDVA